MTSIFEIIPNYAKESDIELSHVSAAIETITMALIIIGMNFKLHDYMFDDVKKRIRTETPEGITTIVLISCIAFIIFYFLLKYLSDGYGKLLEPLFCLFYIIVILFSVIIYFFQSIYNSISPMFDFSNDSSDSKFVFSDFDTRVIPNYGLLFAMVGVIMTILYKAAYDPKSLTSNTYSYVLLILIPSIFAFYISGPLIASENGSGMAKLGLIGLLLLIFSAVIYFYINMNSSSLGAMSYLIVFCLLLITIVGLAMLFYMVGNYLKSFTGIPGFVVYFIFYIPCLLIDFAKYILKEFSMTSQLIYVLFFIEIALILLYNYLPKLVDYIDKKDGVVLLQDGVFLDKATVIGTSKVLEIPESKLENDNYPIVYEKNYSFSMWIYLKNQPSNFSSYSQETTIFDCGGGKPKITYYNNIKDEVHKNKYIIYFTDRNYSVLAYEITLPIQKWNNFVFNYSSSKVNLFVNGELVKSFQFTNNNPKIVATDNITVGSDKGLDGAICNVRYYPYNLSISHITSSYNLLMYKNPPVIIL